MYSECMGLKYSLRIVMLSALLRASDGIAIEFIRMPESDSMAPELTSGSQVVLDRSAYKKEPPSRTDIVAFQAPLSPEIVRVGRIVALPKEVFSIREGAILINQNSCIVRRLTQVDCDKLRSRLKTDPLARFYRCEEQRCGKDRFLSLGELEFEDFGPKTMGDDEYFIMNDNRSIGMDSRSFGAIKASAILGKVLVNQEKPKR